MGQVREALSGYVRRSQGAASVPLCCRCPMERARRSCCVSPRWPGGVRAGAGGGAISRAGGLGHATDLGHATGFP
jgi:hypothetical protein